MSSYIHVFVRKDDTFFELAEGSRNSVLYRFLRHAAPYGKIAPISEEDLRDAYHAITGEIDCYREDNEHDKQTITEIGQWHNTVEEKFEAINEIQQGIAERDEELAELEVGRALLSVLLYLEGDKYVGIDCGSAVTVNDIAPLSAGESD